MAALALAALPSCSTKSAATEVKDALARSSGLRVAAGEIEVDLERVHFSDVTVSMDGPRALVVAMVQAGGRLSSRKDAGGATVAYVGREAFTMERCEADVFCPKGEHLPVFSGVLSVLPALEGALRREAGEPLRVVGWQIRIERDRAPVGADYELGGAVPRRFRARWDLEREGAGWRLSPSTPQPRGPGPG